ncbi:MAG TPA: LacI family DNA-binding transcriptional regulator, partial [Streptosporangiaceae bacterium]|nr:LacI family DNA-binding transcriptional regulator [Streptosporangiaceae bacterium]
MDSRDTASAALDVARPADDAARRGGLARASQGGAGPDDGLHDEQAGSLLQGELAAGGLVAGGGLGSRRHGPVAPPTIYDVASAAGVSIASVSRVLNGRGNPLPETRERVLAAVADLGFIPDGAARALSARLKEIIGVVIRRPPP